MKTTLIPFGIRISDFFRNSEFGFRSSFLFLLLGLTAWTPPALAVVPEPPNELYGIIELDGTVVNDANTNVVVEARLLPAGGTVASYRMGTTPNPNHYYNLRVRVESQAPVADTNASLAGTLLYITVLKDGAVRDQLAYTLGEPGTVQRLDFGAVDNDHDGLPDGWEQLYYGNTGRGPNEDTDRDGLTNLQEYQLGTNPNKADARHPADISPADGRITIAELAAYYSAWKAGRPWSVAPTNIPQAYVTRASFLWEGGEYYKFNESYQYPTNFNGTPEWWASAEPDWWINVPAPTAKSAFAKSASLGAAPLAVESIAPAQFQPGQPFTVINRVTLQPGLRAYTVEDFPPKDWVVSAISHSGSYDAVNHKVRWGPYFDKQPRDLSYQVQSPAQTYGRITFTGRASYDGYYVDLNTAKQVVYLPVPSLVNTRKGAVLEWAVAGFAGAIYRLEASADLKQWTVLSTQPAGADGTLRFQPGDAQRESYRFYRAVLVEPPVNP